MWNKIFNYMRLKTKSPSKFFNDSIKCGVSKSCKYENCGICDKCIQNANCEVDSYKNYYRRVRK